MPYSYKKEGDKYVVYKKSTGQKVGSTDGTKEALRKYLAALHMNEKQNNNINMKHIKSYNDFINESKGDKQESESIDEANVNYSFLTDKKSLDYIKSKGVEDTGDFIDFLKGTIQDNLEDDPKQYEAVILKYYFDNKKEMDAYLKDYVAHVQGK